MGIESTALSPGECSVARGLRDIAVAGFAQLAHSGRMAGCGALGTPPGGGRIGGVDNGDEKHRIEFVLPAVDPFLCKMVTRISHVPMRNASYALSLLFAALAMAAKSSTVILPVVLCLCAWWIEGRWHWRTVARSLLVHKA